MRYKGAVTRSKRPRLGVANSYDSRARLAVVVLALPGGATRELVLRGVAAGPLPLTALESALTTARELGLRDFVLDSATPLPPLPPAAFDGLGDVRLRTVKRRKNGPARLRAHRRLRELVPLDETWSLADHGIDLELARMTDLPDGSVE